VNKAFATGC